MESSSAENKPASRRQRKAKSICLPFDHEAAYPTCMSDPTRYRAYKSVLTESHEMPFPFTQGPEGDRVPQSRISFRGNVVSCVSCGHPFEGGFVSML